MSSFSWERNKDQQQQQASDSNGEPRNSTRAFGQRRDINQKKLVASKTLFVTGYQCKFYRDQERWQSINARQHMLMWNGDPNMLLDRYDVRFLRDPAFFEKPTPAPLTSTDVTLESELDKERYADLKYDEDEDHESKEQATSSGVRANCIPYTYDKEESNKSDEHNKSDDDSSEDDPFEPPSNLNVPSGITLPKSKKLNQVIEKTACFVAEQGAQMEILIKMKQSDNSNFKFLSHDSPLHPYYQLILREIKSGRYSPNVAETQPSNDGSGDDDSGDEGYLHPSLLSSNIVNSRPTLPSLNKNIAADSHYSKLVQTIKDKFADDIELVEEKKLAPSSDSKTVTSSVKPEGPSLLPIPPDEIEKIITKMAEHVAKAGQCLEDSIKSLKDGKFDFVNKGHLYHPYYVKQKIHFAKLFNKKLPTIKPEEPTNFIANNKTVAFSIQKPAKKPSKVVTIPPCDEDNQSDEEQEEKDSNKKMQQIRRQKLALFLKNMKNDQTTASTSKRVQTYGPQLPTKPSSIELSPTTKAITDLDFESMSPPTRSPSRDLPPLSTVTKCDPPPTKVVSNSPPRLYKDFDEDSLASSRSSSDDEHRSSRRHREDERKKKKEKKKHKHHSYDRSPSPRTSSGHRSKKHKHKHRHRHHHDDDHHSNRDKDRKAGSSRHYRHRSRSRSRS